VVVAGTDLVPQPSTWVKRLQRPLRLPACSRREPPVVEAGDGSAPRPTMRRIGNATHREQQSGQFTLMQIPP